MKQKKKKSSFLVPVILLVLVAAAAVGAHFLTKVSLYASEDTTGNTSGNLLNGGLVCAYRDKIYFANPYDENTLYAMDTDLTNARQISEDNVSYLNIAGKYIFYTKRNDQKDIDSDSFMAFQSTGLYRSTLSGKSVSQLYGQATQVACLYGNYVYYQHYDLDEGLMLYRAKIDGSSDELLLDDACAPYAVFDGTIYFTGYRNDHSIHALSADGTTDTVLLEGNYTGLSMQGDFLYFLDMSDDYALKRMSIDGNTPETLVSMRLATYNVSEDGTVLYCQVDNATDENGLYKYDLETEKLTLLSAGNYNYLHLTDDYLFYESYDQSALYVMDLATETAAQWTQAEK